MTLPAPSLREMMRDYVVRQWQAEDEPGPLIGAVVAGQDGAVVEIRRVLNDEDRILAFREALGIAPAVGADEVVMAGPGRDAQRTVLVTVVCRRVDPSKCEVESTIETWTRRDGLQPLPGDQPVMVEPALLEALALAVLGKDRDHGIGRAPLSATWTLKAKGHSSWVARPLMKRLGAAC